MSDFSAYTFTMAKTASMAGFVRAMGGKAMSNAVKNVALGVTGAVGLTALSANLMSTIFNKISNDTRRKAIIEDLALNDPILKEVDRDSLKEWYATMYYYAPTLTADRATVREVLTGFARFGRIDLQTLKMLAETEERLAKIKSSGVVQYMPKMSV